MLPSDQCTGCGACFSSCPKQCILMLESVDGFQYPNIQAAQCIHCGKCEVVCPVLHNFSTEDTHSTQALPESYGAFSTAENARMKSSSGAVFYELAAKVLHASGVVYGVAYDENNDAVFKRIDSLSDLNELQGSKYVQASSYAAYSKAKTDLDSNTPVLFSGTPCQISGLKHYLGREYSNLITIDFVCHGVPSPKAFQKYKTGLEIQYGSRITKINFRNKETGWRSYSVKVDFENGKTYQVAHQDDPYMTAFLRELSLRESCFSCNFKGLHRESDITLSDYWGIEHTHPEIPNERGVSMVLLHSETGRRYFEEIRENLNVFDAELSDMECYNPSSIRSSVPHPFRQYFFRMLGKRNYTVLVENCMKPSKLIRLHRKLLKLFADK